MEWYNRYVDKLTVVFAEAQQRIAAYPAPLNEWGLKYAAKFDPVNTEGGKDYICSLLPFWVQNLSGISDEQSKRLALANVYGMLYYFIQDDVMDDDPAARVKESLALGNLLLLDMLAVWRSLFPADSPFWGYYEQYAATWADSVINEASANYFVHDPLRTAGKAGPVKSASTGALLLTGRDAFIPELEQAVDIALMTLQMSDDWTDWKVDLAEGSYNGLIAMLAASSSRPADAPITEQLIETAIYVRGCMSQFAEIAAASHDRLLSLSISSSISELVDFHSFLVKQLQQTAASIDTNRKRLLQGGFSYFLDGAAVAGEQ
jgi:hypothetical protein